MPSSGLTSSQTDSTFQASEADNSASESERSDGDRPEIDVSSVIRSLLVRICREHKDANGYKFTAGYDAETLTVPICGDFPKTTPDLILRLEQNKRLEMACNTSGWTLVALTSQILPSFRRLLILCFAGIEMRRNATCTSRMVLWRSWRLVHGHDYRVGSFTFYISWVAF